MNDPRNSADYESRFAELEHRLASPTDDEAMLSEVGVAIRHLLTGNEDSERRIRQILERQYDHGNLRKETYELVENLLAKLAAEFVGSNPDETIADESYTRTAVIEQPGQAPQEPDATNQLQIGTVLRDRYLLKESVSEGSMGIVYKALDRRLAETGEENCYVAIKVLSPKLARNAAALRALQQEAAKGRCLSHPNIVRFIDLDRENGLYFIVMEWLEGQSLSMILDQSRKDAIDLPKALDIVRQAASALEYAHQRGVVHADVKPGNIMITPGGQVKLVDFGVARVRQKENEGRARFDPDMIRAATPAYSSMQVLTGEEPVPADDVFSLGCLLYRLVAGYRVFGPRNAADAAEQGMEPQQPPGLSDKQWQTLRKALSYSRVTRYQSPTAFIEALGGASGKVETKKVEAGTAARATTMSAGVDVGPPRESLLHVDQESIMYEPHQPARRSPWRLAVIGIIIVASAAVVFESGVIDSISGLPALNRSREAASPALGSAAEDAPNIDELTPMPAVDIAATNDEAVEELVIDADSGAVETVATETIPPADDDSAEPMVDEPGDAPEPAPAAVEASPAIDFSTLPPPTVLMALPASSDEMPLPESITLREDGEPAIVDLVRSGDLSGMLSVQFVEAQVSGSRAAWDAGQYALENDGLLVFEPGQPRARMRLTMQSDTVREPDRSVVLSIRNTADPDVSLGTINVALEDDDQRRFESSLPSDTVAFTVNQVTVRESDPAVQVDVVRYHPGKTAIEVAYRLTDVTATEGQDYFGPSLPRISFAPGQRSARILIPLGQDGRPEPNEAFTLELQNQSIPDGSDIFSQIAVIIRDDDS